MSCVENMTAPSVRARKVQSTQGIVQNDMSTTMLNLSSLRRICMYR
eukprot:COSAG02_NODE_2975_length_7633_cov_3.190072_3_plen_46_part_00